MNKHEFISREISIWGEDYVFDLINRGYEPVQLNVNGVIKWWWKSVAITTNDNAGTARTSLDAGGILC